MDRNIEQSSENIEKGDKLSLSDAEAQLGYLLDLTTRMGANDSEIPELLTIREELKSGSISPLDAVRRANEIYNSKQDYH